MIFNLSSPLQQTCLILIFLCCIVFLTYQICYQYYVFHNVHRDYQHTFGTPMDDITHDKLVKYWNTSPYEDFFSHSQNAMVDCKTKKIIFTGLCQDNGKNFITMWLPWIKKVGSHFRDYRIIIVENDSKDNTREILLKEAEKNPRLLLLCDGKRPENTQTCHLGMRSIHKNEEKETHLAQRLSILRKFRQVYWDYVQEKYNDYDYMAIIDWDLEGDVSTPGFFHGLSYVKDHSDVIATNSFHKIGKNYHFHDTFPLLNNHRCENLHQNKLIQDHMMKIQMHTKTLYGSAYPVPVESAFGGLALYHIHRLMEKQCSYVDVQCPVECEHTTFHKNLNVHIDPWMTFYITKNHH